MSMVMINILSKIKLIHKQNGKHNLLCICVDFKSELFIYLFLVNSAKLLFIYLFFKNELFLNLPLKIVLCLWVGNHGRNRTKVFPEQVAMS